MDLLAYLRVLRRRWFLILALTIVGVGIGAGTAALEKDAPKSRTYYKATHTLVLDTTSAHTFNFVLPNVGTGTHLLTVQAQISTDNTSIFSNSNGGVSASNALFGLGSLTVDAVRLVNSFTCSADSTGALTCGN